MPLAKPPPKQKQKSKAAPPAPIQTANLNPFRTTSSTKTSTNTITGNTESNPGRSSAVLSPPSQQQQQQQQQQHPHTSTSISTSPTPTPAPSSQIQTQTLIFTHPAVARLSSSPASSPRIVDSPAHVRRTRSVKPEMDDIDLDLDLDIDLDLDLALNSSLNSKLGNAARMAGTMERNGTPGPDFFDPDSSSEDGDVDVNGGVGGEEEEEHESEWEDEDTTREFSGFDGIGLGISGATAAGEDEVNNDMHSHSRRNGYMPLEHSATHDSGTALSNTFEVEDVGRDRDRDIDTETENDARAATNLVRKSTKQARSLSMGRAGRAKVVHNQGTNSGTVTPRSNSSVSVGVSVSESNLSTSSSSSSSSSSAEAEREAEADGGVGIPHHNHNHTRARSNTTTSLRAVLRTHAITMRALESISPSASFSLAHAHLRNRSISQPQFPYAYPESTNMLLTTNKNDTFLRSPSLSSSRHISLDPIVTDPNRPPHLPAHFVKTPYPFTSRKEFPKPRSRPRNVEERRVRDREDGDVSAMQMKKGRQVLGIEASESDLRGVKGKKVLGLVDAGADGGCGGGGGGVDLRSQYTRFGQRQRDGRGGREGEGKMGWVSIERDGEGLRSESVLWVSLRCTSGLHGARRARSGGQGRLVNITIPSNLTMESGSMSTPTHKKDNTTNKPWILKIFVKTQGQTETREKETELTQNIDFDDTYLSHALHSTYTSLAGSCFQRTFSARTLSSIELGTVGLWSGGSSSSSSHSRSSTACAGLLATANGSTYHAHTSPDEDLLSPFTESALWDLYKHPAKGKARYTWVHWCRRVARTNVPTSTSTSTSTCTSTSMSNASLIPHTTSDTHLHDDANIDIDGDADADVMGEKTKGARGQSGSREVITTLQFVHTISPTRILVALSLMLTVTIAAVVAWVFFGPVISISASSSATAANGLGNGMVGNSVVSVGRLRSERITSGMGIGVLAFLIQGLVFGVWVFFS